MDDVKFYQCSPCTFLNCYDVFAVGERYQAKFYGWLKLRPHIKMRMINEFEAASILNEHADGTGIGCFVPTRDDILAHKFRNAISQIRLEAFISRHLKAPPGLMLPTIPLPTVSLQPKPAPRAVLSLKLPA